MRLFFIYSFCLVRFIRPAPHCQSKSTTGSLAVDFDRITIEEFLLFLYLLPVSDQETIQAGLAGDDIKIVA